MLRQLPVIEKRTLLFAFVICLLLSGCFKIFDCPDDELPPATQEGKHRLGCLIDGKVWIPKSSGLFDQAIEAVYYRNHNGSLGIQAQKFFEAHSDREYLTIFEENILLQDAYFLTPGSDTMWEDTLGICNPTFHSGYKSLPGGRLTITRLDTINQIIAGTFEFNAYNAECQDTVHITQGRFDLKYTSY